MSCHAAFSGRKRNNSFVCVVNNEDFFFPQRKAVLGSFNLFRTSYNFSPKSTWWFINTYVCTVILNLRILKFLICKVSICLECMYVVKHERSTRVANLLERWLCCSAHSLILPLEVNWSRLQVKISKWIHRWFFSAFESFWLLLFFEFFIVMPFVLFLKSSKDFASTSKYIFGEVLCIAYIIASYSTNTFSISSECVNKIIECTLSLNEFNCLNLVATFIHVFSFLEINDCSN